MLCREQTYLRMGTEGLRFCQLKQPSFVKEIQLLAENVACGKVVFKQSEGGKIE